MADVAWSPVTSIHATPTFTGGLPSSPVIDIIPDLAAGTDHNRAQSFGPVAPYPDMEHRILSPGKSGASLWNVPGRNFDYYIGL